MFQVLSRFALCFLLCAALLSPSFAGDFPASGAINAAQAAELYERHERGIQPGLVFLDVRSRSEFQSGHVQGALNIPVNELGRRMNEVPDGPVVILCRSGRRAANAYDIIVKHGRSAEHLWFYVGFTDYRAGKPRFSN